MTVRLFLTGKFLPNYVEAVFASRRLPPKAAVSACSRHSFVEGIRNGGLDVTQNRRSTWKIHFGLIKNSDLGEWNDIHPLDKKTLGQRAAETALKYNKEVKLQQ